jgi:hypothetical protein
LRTAQGSEVTSTRAGRGAFFGLDAGRYDIEIAAPPDVRPGAVWRLDFLLEAD